MPSYLDILMQRAQAQAGQNKVTINPAGTTQVQSSQAAYAGSNNLNDYYRQFGISMADQLTDFNSNYYQNYRKLMDKMMPTFGADQALSVLAAGGYGGNFAQRLISSKLKDFNAQRTDNLNNAVQAFALKGNELAGNWIQLSQNNKIAEDQIKLQGSINDSQTKFNPAQFVGGLITTAAGAALGNPGLIFGGGSSTIGGLGGGGGI